MTKIDITGKRKDYIGSTTGNDKLDRMDYMIDLLEQILVELKRIK